MCSINTLNYKLRVDEMVVDIRSKVSCEGFDLRTRSGPQAVGLTPLSEN